jgi:hypothetical protein
MMRGSSIVIPAPCGSRSNEVAAEELWPTWEAIAWNEDCLHEWIGLAWYKLAAASNSNAGETRAAISTP